MSAEDVRFCWRCDKPLEPGDKVTTFTKVSMSAAGLTIELHEACAAKALLVRPPAPGRP